MNTNDSYVALNVDSVPAKEVPFTYSVTRRVAEELREQLHGDTADAQTIRTFSEDAMEKAFGTRKVHGYSVPAAEGSNYWDIRAKDKKRRPFETVTGPETPEPGNKLANAA